MSFLLQKNIFLSEENQTENDVDIFYCSQEPKQEEGLGTTTFVFKDLGVSPASQINTINKSQILSS